MAGNDAQVSMDNGTRQWRYKGVSFDGQRKEKGVVEARRRATKPSNALKNSDCIRPI